MDMIARTITTRRAGMPMDFHMPRRLKSAPPIMETSSWNPRLRLSARTRPELKGGGAYTRPYVLSTLSDRGASGSILAAAIDRSEPRASSTQRLEHGGQVLRERALVARARPVRVREREPGGVEEMAGEPRQLGAAVQRVAGERMPDECEVRPDLVQDPGSDLHFHQREAAAAIDRREARRRRARAVGLRPLRVARSPHLARVVRIVQERHVDLPASVQLARHQREVTLLDGPGTELRAQQRM